ncbi:MAG: AraC family transcriptional regulator, partial [Deltaproteobacteria bacterium]|nr:AraC family transcriptional regulator [Deltaproteobacteria bacterium]
MNRYDGQASSAVLKEIDPMAESGRRKQEAKAGVARDRRVLAACRFIEESADRVPSLGEIARRVGLSPYYLQRIFKQALGVTPRQYADAQRVQRLKAKLQRG